MRIAALNINGFRAWKHEVTLDLAADAVIIIARNGQGKTSLLDAIMWSLTGSVPRLGSDDALISQYSETGQAFVSVDLQEAVADKMLKVSRLFDGTSQNVQVEFGGKVLVGAAATQCIIEKLWPTAKSAPEPASALLAAFTRSIYLQQDLVRDFIQDQDKQARFAAVSEIIGTGRVTELQLQLDRAKTAWTKSTNERHEEGSALRKRLGNVREQLSAMTAGPIDLATLETQWMSWWLQTSPVIGDNPALSAASPRAASELDRALKLLYSSEMALGRQIDELRETLAFLQTKPPAVLSSEPSVAERVKALDTEIETLTTEFDELRKRQKVFEVAEAERSKTQTEMVQLARLALRHLKERCPVCDQTYDSRSTHARLEKLLRGTGLHLPAEQGFEKEVAAKTAASSKLTERRTLLAAEQRQAAQANERIRLWQTERTRRAEAFPESLSDEDVTQAIVARTHDIWEETLKIQRLRKSGEQLALQIASTSEAQRRAELLQELKSLAEAVERAEAEFGRRNATGELAGRILNALRESAGDLVKDQLREIEPVLQRIYETCDPHPALKAVRLVSGMFRGRGQLGTVIEDPENENVRSDDPARILSSSQINVLAVSLFLALNLTVRSLPLQCAILDDPLQSLDDLNLLGLVDVLRHVKDQRQMFISTHDHRFGSLLRRKLRPVQPGQRTRVIEISDWSREGPIINQYDALYEAGQSHGLQADAIGER
jgi:DNA repair exonuclease SbcCD ATPase subunit